jgi:Replicative DNA helicase
MEKLNLVKSTFDQLPNNIEAEQAVLGSILVSNEIFDDVSPIVNSKNFFDPMHQKIFSAIEKLIFSGMLANPITLKNFFENEKDDLNIPDYLIKITKFSSSSRQTIEYSKLIYDLFVKRELIKISENLSYTAKSNDLDKDGKTIIEDTEKTLFD